MGRVVLGVCVLAAVVAAFPLVSGGAMWPDGVRGQSFQVDALSADLNGDKVFDDLSARLEGMEDDDRLSVIVRMKGDLTSAGTTALERAVGGFELEGSLPIVDGFAATMTKTQVEAVARSSSVATVEKNAVVHAFNDSAQAASGVTAARSQIPGLDGDKDGNPAVYTPADVVVGVIDSGIDASHPQLDDGKVIAFVDCQTPVSGMCTPKAPFDDNDHGTHVAGTIAGDGEGNPTYQGVAPGAALVGIKVLDDTGFGLFSEIIAGIQWAVANRVTHGIEAINLSLGANGCHNGNDVASAAVNAAVAGGLVVLVAAGNDGPGPCTVGTPGVATNVITVGAMADTGVPDERDPATGNFRARVPGFNQAAFSSRGPTLDGRIKPDVSAPGVHITSADANSGGGYVAFQGTSMATPFTAGAAALMLDHNIALTHAQIKTQLMSTAVDWGRGGPFHELANGPDVDYGAGRLDAFAAIKAVGAPLGVPPQAPAHSVFLGNLAGTDAAQNHSINVTDTSVPLAATLIMPGWTGPASPDFDLRLFDPNGIEIAVPGFYRTRQEEVGVLPTQTGSHTVRVESFFGSGTYILDISGGTLVASPLPPQLPPLPQLPPPPQPPPPPPPPLPVRPPAVVLRCNVPNVKGKTLPQARAALRARRCRVGTIRRVFHPRVKKGRVIAQSRRPGTRPPRNTKINLTLSKGKRRK